MDKAETLAAIPLNGPAAAKPHGISAHIGSAVDPLQLLSNPALAAASQRGGWEMLRQLRVRENLFGRYRARRVGGKSRSGSASRLNPLSSS